MPVTEAAKRAHAKYMKGNYSRLNVQYPTEFVEYVKAHAEASGESMAGYVRKAIEDRIAREEKKEASR